MDDRFPKYLRWIVRKLDFMALPNLGLLICGLAVLGFIGNKMLGAPLERFVFDPDLVLQGEWWRLFAFPTLTDPIWLLFFVLFTYYVMMTLEAVWGTGPLTIFTLLSYLAALGASFLAHRPLSIWVYVIANVGLAFGTIFPDVEMYIFFLLPVKAKWLALFAGALYLLQFLAGGMITKMFLLVVLSPYLLFFSPMLYQSSRRYLRNRRNNRRF